MAREQNKLSARFVQTVTKPGRHSDGGGLYLIVDPSGAKRWLFLFRWGGKLKELGLGGLSAVTLAQAREKASDARRQVAAGTNPIAAKRAAADAKAAAKTFSEVADALIASITPGFKNEKHKAQWSSTLETYASHLSKLAVADISTDDILKVLQPIWLEKPETASRVRGRVERVLDAAKARGLRSGENPARWRGHLDHLLARRPKTGQQHHAAMPYDAMPAFMTRLRAREAVAASALEFGILCASRTGEIIEARWDEFDRAAKVWTIPAVRMKAGREHRVPLTDRALAILDCLERIRTSEFVFPGPRRGKPLSNMALAMLMRRLECADYTVHGFRSSFRDWAGEKTAFPREVAEAALAHVVGDETERAYRRGDALEKRRQMMDAWATFLATPSAARSNIATMPTKTA